MVGIFTIERGMELGGLLHRTYDSKEVRDMAMERMALLGDEGLLCSAEFEGWWAATGFFI